MTGAGRLRVVVAGPDGPDAATAVALARALRDAGVEVVLAGPATSADGLAATVVQEDADAVALTGAPPDLPAGLLDRLAAVGADDVVVVAVEDVAAPSPGVRRFPRDTAPDDVVAALRSALAP